eukprot:11575645-Karenia_brevis.AAC.1
MMMMTMMMMMMMMTMTMMQAPIPLYRPTEYIMAVSLEMIGQYVFATAYETNLASTAILAQALNIYS